MSGFLWFLYNFSIFLLLSEKDFGYKYVKMPFLKGTSKMKSQYKASGH